MKVKGMDLVECIPTIGPDFHWRITGIRRLILVVQQNFKYIPDHSSNLQYLGGPLLNSLGLAKDIHSADEPKLKEIKNGENPDFSKYLI